MEIIFTHVLDESFNVPDDFILWYSKRLSNIHNIEKVIVPYVYAKQLAIAYNDIELRKIFEKENKIVSYSKYKNKPRITRMNTKEKEEKIREIISKIDSSLNTEPYTIENAIEDIIKLLKK